MNWIKDLTIAKKILAFVTMSVAFILIVGLVGFYFATQLSGDMTSLYKDRTQPVGWLNEMSTLGRKNESNILKVIFTRSSEKRKEYITEINAVGVEFLDLLKKYEATNLDSFEVENLAKLKQELADYKAVRIKIAELSEQAGNNQSLDAHQYYLKHTAEFENFNNRLRALAEYNEKAAEKLSKQGQEDAVIASVLIFVTIIVAAIFAVFFGLMIANMISKPIEKVVGNLNEVAKGNLTVKDVENDSKDEVGMLATALNATVSHLKGLIGTVAKSVENISASSEEMSASAEQSAQGAEQTANSTQQLAQGAQDISINVERGANTIGNMNDVIQIIAKEADAVSDLSRNTELTANAGSEQVKKAVGKIDNIKIVAGDISVTVSELGKLSSDIEQIVDLIKSIAGQTNLLALNAAIEAARAGEHGKGFAVVADEVKKLASQSAGATDKITSMIKEIQSKTGIAVKTMDRTTVEVEEGVTVVNEAGVALENIISQVKAASSKIQGITKQIEGVALNSQEVVAMVENISAVTQETAASAEEISSITEEQTASMEEISASAQTLAKIAEELNKQVSVFRI